MKTHSPFIAPVVLMACLILALTSCGRHKTPITGTDAEILFEDTLYDYGKLARQDGKVSHVFKFRNSGAQPLLIHKIETGCHCTASDYPRHPIASGEEGEITIIFDTQDTNVGAFHKTISVYTNSKEGLNRLTIQGFVYP